MFPDAEDNELLPFPAEPRILHTEPGRTVPKHISWGCRSLGEVLEIMPTRDQDSGCCSRFPLFEACSKSRASKGALNK